MEDYLEMIFRMSVGEVRVNELAKNLNVRPSSASKMVDNLRAGGYIDFEKYGVIVLTEKGKQAGEYLLHRHEILHEFLCLINNSDNELEQVEKIEHFINENTLLNIEKLIVRLKGEC
jgi:Mn-dependent DtxR family transcriptional regulator